VRFRFLLRAEAGPVFRGMPRARRLNLGFWLVRDGSPVLSRRPDGGRRAGPGRPGPGCRVRLAAPAARWCGRLATHP